MTLSIERVETFRVNYPVSAHFKFLSQPGRQGGVRPTIVVKLATISGHVGWGQCVPSPSWSYETIESVETTIINHLAPALRGMDALDSARIWEAMNRAIAPSFSTGQPIAKAGIDLALHNLAGRCLGQSLAKQWNLPTGDPVKLSWTLNPLRLDDVAPQIEQAGRLGYESFNIKVAPNLAFDRQVCRLVRELAPQAFVWADANGGYDERTAVAACDEFAELGLMACEQPLPANRLTGYQRLCRRGALPILMDEGIVSKVDLEEFLQLKMLNGVAIKVARSGGLTESVRLMRLARDEGLLMVGSGLTDPDLSLAASVGLFSAFQLAAPAALNGPQYLSTSILRQPLMTRNGMLSPPAGPGLGVEVDEGRLQLG
jgi:L-alanine-DL-glutamate epimerase-like enolase superfamily enzyme